MTQTALGSFLTNKLRENAHVRIWRGVPCEGCGQLFTPKRIWRGGGRAHTGTRGVVGCS